MGARCTLPASSPEPSLFHPKWEETALATLVGYLDAVQVQVLVVCNLEPQVGRLVRIYRCWVKVRDSPGRKLSFRQRKEAPLLRRRVYQKV